MWLCLSSLCWPDGGLHAVMWLRLSSLCWPDCGLQLCGYVCLPCAGLIVVYSYVVMFVFPVLA